MDQVTSGGRPKAGPRLARGLRGPFGGAAVRTADQATPEPRSRPVASRAVGHSVRPADRGRANVRTGLRDGDPRALVIGCGALARELLAVAEPIPGLEVACLAPDLHNRP